MMMQSSLPVLSDITGIQKKKLLEKFFFHALLSEGKITQQLRKGSCASLASSVPSDCFLLKQVFKQKRSCQVTFYKM